MTVYYGGLVEPAPEVAPITREALIAELTAIVTATLKDKPIDPDNIDSDIARFCAALKPTLDRAGLPNVDDIDLGFVGDPRRSFMITVRLTLDGDVVDLDTTARPRMATKVRCADIEGLWKCPECGWHVRLFPNSPRPGDGWDSCPNDGVALRKEGVA